MIQNIELFAKIENYPKYLISNYGNVLKNGKPVKTTVTRGYKYVSLTNEDETKTVRLHRLMAQTFLPNPENKEYVDHIDGNPLNNHLTNLRWATATQNQGNRKKVEYVMGKPTSSKYIGVCFIKKNGRYQSCIKNNNKKIYLGEYVNEIDAAKAYDEKAKEIRGEFARLNFN